MMIIVMVLLGLCFGSFANAVVWRIHEQAKPQKKRAAREKDLSIATGRSMCPHCQRTLAWYDLLPIVSWLTLRGRCRYCDKSISWQYPLVELSTALLFVLSYLVWPLGWGLEGKVLFGFWLLFVLGFIMLFIYDLRWMLLPDRIVYPLQWLALAYILIRLLAFHGDWPEIWSASLGVVFSAGIFYALFQLSRGRWIGGGDVKLAVVLGLLLGGPIKALLMIFLASVIGSMVAVPLLLAGKAKHTTKLPFGPCLIVATVIVYLFGPGIIAWYTQHLLLV